jgi:hypothetical protein
MISCPFFIGCITARLLAQPAQRMAIRLAANLPHPA